jgi:hypothetical protein
LRYPILDGSSSRNYHDAIDSSLRIPVLIRIRFRAVPMAQEYQLSKGEEPVPLAQDAMLVPDCTLSNPQEGNISPLVDHRYVPKLV